MHIKPLALASVVAALAVTSAGCKQADTKRTAETTENGAQPLPAPAPGSGPVTVPPGRAEGEEGRYEPTADFLGSGRYAKKPFYVNLQGTGPNGSKKFFVEYTATLGYDFSEFKKGGRRHCRWNYPGDNRIDRILYLEQTPGNLKAIGNKGVTKPAPEPDETQDNCNNVWNNVIRPRLDAETDYTAWSSWIEKDMVEVRDLIGKPLP